MRTVGGLRRNRSSPMNWQRRTDLAGGGFTLRG